MCIDKNTELVTFEGNLTSTRGKLKVLGGFMLEETFQRILVGFVIGITKIDFSAAIVYCKIYTVEKVKICLVQEFQEPFIS